MTAAIRPPVRFGVIGLGNIGALHCRTLLSGEIKRAELAAVCDSDPARLAAYAERARVFSTLDGLLAAGVIDALVIATPHPAHVPGALQALGAGRHVLVEKPLSTHRAACESLLAGHTDARLRLGVVYNQRANPALRHIRSMIQTGELGAIRRVQWTATDGFRPAAYYASGAWRGTWRGEGGGILLNQSSHYLDVLCWLFGVPRRVRAHCHFGRYHAIEVEDEATAYCELPDGATAVFITSNGEAPGTNRLEIAAERGRLVLEHEQLHWLRNETPMTEFSRASREAFAAPPTTATILPVVSQGAQHAAILQNFTDAILDGVPLLAPAEEAVHAVELANAMLLSTWLDRPVDLPIDARNYAALLQERIDRRMP